jgi:hypothetical protein
MQFLESCLATMLCSCKWLLISKGLSDNSYQEAKVMANAPSRFVVLATASKYVAARDQGSYVLSVCITAIVRMMCPLNAAESRSYRR